MAHSQFFLLRTRRFLPLFLTQFLGAFNDNAFKNAMVILITYTMAQNSGSDARILVTAAAGLFILPFFLFSATAGQLADKYEKSRLIRRIKLAEIILMTMGAIGFYLQSVPLLMLVLFLMGTQSAFFGPLKYSIIPDLLPEDEMIGGNALVEAGTFLAILTGTILGGILILKEGGAAMMSAIVVAVALAGWLASMRISHAGPAAPHLRVNKNILTETWKIVAHARERSDVFLSIIGISWFWLVGFVFLAQFPVYGKELLAVDENVVTLFLAAFSVGIAVGSLVCNRLLKGEISGSFAHIGAWGMAASIIFLCAVSPLAGGVQLAEELAGAGAFLSLWQGWLVLFAIMLIAIFGGIYIVPLYAIMQSRSEKSHRSRTVAANNILNAFFMVAGALAVVALTAMQTGILAIFAILGVINVPVGFLVRRIVLSEQAKRRQRET